MRSVIEKQLRGQLRCFKRSSLAQRLCYIMSIFCKCFKHREFQELRISRKMASLKSWKSRQKQGMDLQPFQIFKTMSLQVLLTAGGSKSKYFILVEITRRVLIMDTTKSTHKSLNDVIRHVLTIQTTESAIIYDDIASKQIVSYKQLSEIILEGTNELAKHCKEREVVGVSSESPLAALYLFLSVIKIKAVACTLVVPDDAEQFIETCIKFHIKHMIIGQNSIKDIPELRHQLKRYNAFVKPLKISDSNLAIITFQTIKSRSLSLRENGIEFIVASSGSTGTPKMIKVPGKCIMPNILDLCNIFKVSKSDVIFMSSPLTFDASIAQIFVSLLSGATLLVVPDSIKKQPSKLSNILFSRNHSSILQATPSFVHLLGESLLSNGKRFCDTSLRILCLGAEPFLPRNVIKRLIGNINTIQLYNIYGISEVSSWASIEKVSLAEPVNLCEEEYSTDSFIEDSCLLISKARLKEIRGYGVPIGEPLTGTVIEVRSDSDQTISNGVGEIWVGGTQRVCIVGDETELMPNTMRPTGDSGYISNGKIYYLQRKDRRLKIFGHFIDLEMIEIAVEEIPEVKASICIAVEGKNKTIDALILFLSVGEGKVTTNLEEKVAKKLSRDIPTHGLQFKIEILGEIPLNAHGKKDRISLEKLAIELQNTTNEVYVWETSSVENVLFTFLQTSVCKNTKGIVSYDKERTFIENGGDSFTALFVVNKIREYLRGTGSQENELNMLFDYVVSKTFSELCQYVQDKLEKAYESSSNGKDTLSNTVNGVDNVNKYGDASNNSFTVNIDEEITDEGSDKYTDVFMGKANNFVFHGKRASSGTEDRVNSSPDQSDQCEVGITNFSSVLNDLNGAKRRRDIVVRGEIENVNATEKFRLKGATFGVLQDPTRSIEISEEIDEKEISHTSMPEKDVSALKKVCECFCSVSRGNRYTMCHHCSDLGNLTECLSSHSTNTTESCNLIIKWHYDTSKCVDASPLVVCSRDNSASIVYIGSHSHSLVAIDANNGNALWNTKLGDRIESSAAISKCGNKIIVGCYDHYVYILSRKNGEILWKFKTGDCVKCSPIVDQSNGIVYFGSHDQFLYAVNIEDNLQIWRVFCGGGSCFSSPSLSEDLQKIFVGTLGGNFLAISTAAGEVLWTFKVTKPIFSSPVVYGEFTCFSCVDGIIYMLQQNGTLLWKFQTNGPIFSSACLVRPSLKGNFEYPERPSLANERDCLDKWLVTDMSEYQESSSSSRKSEYMGNASSKSGSLKGAYFTSNRKCLEYPSLLSSNDDCILIGSHDNHLYCLTNNGHLIWNFEANSPVYSTPAISHCRTTERSENTANTLQRNFAVACSTKGTLYVIDLANGELLTSRDFPGEIFSSPVVVGNSIVVGCRDNNVYFIQLQ